MFMGFPMRSLLPPWQIRRPLAGDQTASPEFQRWLEDIRILSIIPAGTLRQGLGLASSGWFLCDGAAVSKAVHPELFAVVGNTYGETAETFNLPTINATLDGVAVSTFIKF